MLRVVLLFLYAALQCSVTLATSSPEIIKKQQIVLGVDAGTESIRACFYDAMDGRVVGRACSVAYTTTYAHPGWAEQDPTEWYEALGACVRGAVSSLMKDETDSKQHEYKIVAMALDTTCCSVVALNDAYMPLRPCLLWMDQRSAPQTLEIMRTCRGDDALRINCDGHGPMSAEWLLPKALWICQEEPDIWKQATTICEYQDYMNYQLTGVMCANSCHAAARWNWDGHECLLESNEDNPFPGRPLSLYQTLGISELATKLPQKCLPMGAMVGRLTHAASIHLNLPQGTLVVQGGPDAFVGMIGLGCIHAGQLCLITGSSHLQCVVTSNMTTSREIWGPYKGAPLPNMMFAEGGQSSTGSTLRWAKNLFGGTDTISYKTLDDEAAVIPPGAHGLVALATFQGQRTPTTDPFLRGAFVGLTLSHTRGHIWRALLEAVCYGTRACIEGLTRAGHPCTEIIIAGGVTRSRLWLQMHADVTGKTVIVCENSDAPLLGCAILASVGAGIHKSVLDGVNAMVRTSERIEPDPEMAAQYDRFYTDIYSKVPEAVRPISRALYSVLSLQGGETKRHDSSVHATSSTLGKDEQAAKSTNRRTIVISPSLLACDWTRIGEEVRKCLLAGATRLHVDIFDGVFLDSPNAFTFGPQMVKAIRKSCDECSGPKAILDLHMCTHTPARFVGPMAAAGANRFIFQWEACASLEEAIDLVLEITSAGLACGVSINPGTNVDEIFPLLETNMIDVVTVLAVHPGFGGQRLQKVALETIAKVRQWRRMSGVDFEILVDGGINHETAGQVVLAGADVLVSGSFVFHHPGGISLAVLDLITESKPFR